MDERKIDATPNPNVPIEAPRWKMDLLREAIKTFNGRVVEPVIDQSPNRGTGWMK